MGIPASMRPRQSRLGIRWTALGSGFRLISGFNEAEAITPRNSVAQGHRVAPCLTRASMRPRQSRLGIWPWLACPGWRPGRFNEAEAITPRNFSVLRERGFEPVGQASMRPRQSRLGIWVLVRGDEVAAILGFNEAEAITPRNSRVMGRQRGINDERLQ